jgi:hypothetical protein
MRSAGDGRPHRPSFDSSGSSYDAGAVPLPLAGHGSGGTLPAGAGDHAALLSGPPPSFAGGGHGGGNGGLPGLRSGAAPGGGSGGGRSTDQRLFVADGARNASTQSTNSVFEPVSASQLDAIFKGSAGGGGGREGTVPNAPGAGSAGGPVPSVLDEARGLLAFGGYQQAYSSDQQLVRFSAKCCPAAAQITYCTVHPVLKTPTGDPQMTCLNRSLNVFMGYH